MHGSCHFYDNINDDDDDAVNDDIDDGIYNYYDTNTGNSLLNL